MSALSIAITSLFLTSSSLSLPSVAIAPVGMVLLIVVTTRLAILFPAIAVETPGATPGNAWADSKGHALRIFLIFLLASLPLIVVMFLIFLPFGLNAPSFGLPLMLAVLVSSIFQAFFFFICVAIASRLFQALADRLVRA